MQPLNILVFYAAQCPLFSVSLVSSKNSLIFNILSTPAIIFIAHQNCYHVTNNMIDKGNVNTNNNDSAIIYKIGSFSLTVGKRGRWGFLTQGQYAFLSSLWGKWVDEEHSLPRTSYFKSVLFAFFYSIMEQRGGYAFFIQD